MSGDDFPSRLLLALKALSISRGRLASELAVDKSVVSRWLSGRQAPTGQNLANLTALVAGHRPGFSLLDWESDLETLSAKLGVASEGANNAWGPLAAWLPESVLRETKTLTDLRGDAYEGHWRTTRPAMGQRGRFVHDACLIRKAGNGFLTTRIAVEDMRFEGWTFMTQTQLFSVLSEPRTGMFTFSIFNAVLRHRAEVLDGISMGLQRVGGGSPAAMGCLMERVGFLSGDPAADDAAFEAAAQADPLAPEGSIPPEVAARLMPDVGPTALAAGGMAILHMPFATSLSRGPHR
ncbi:helix-turn-helix domain-containing protein [Phenylobacterium sp.]|uniref:helix-turn-helix domain-containing protein n=1 Tax=Phenylobacterium sp. TaxID=1871053 RepID=UPI003BAC116B